LNLGLRWDSYDTEAKRQAGVNSAGTAVTALSASNNDAFLNYQAGLIFKPAEEGSIYVSYSTESTPATVGGGDEDAVTAANAILKPEKTRTAEIGAKWEFFERVLVSGAIFDSERKNASIAGSMPTPASRSARRGCAVANSASAATSRATGRCSAATRIWTASW
jgi:catecholate siderophore receptor